MKKSIIVVVVLAIACWIHTPAVADDSPLENALSNLAEALKNDPNLAPETKKALTQVIDALEAERASQPIAQSTSVADSSSPQPAQKKLKVSGDLRLRLESSFDQDTSPNRHRERIRLRVGGTWKLDDQFTVGARVITGNPSDPKSPHQTLGGEHSSFDVSLDRVYLKYEPEWSPNTTATLGKFAHPFKRNPVYGELLWDMDVQPEGIAVGHSKVFPGSGDRIGFTVGEYLYKERGFDEDAYITAAQIFVEKKFNDRFSADASVAYYSYSDADLSDQVGNNLGNVLIDTDGDMVVDAYASDFGILNPIASLTYTGWKKLLTVSGEYLHNMRANVSDDSGWAVGAAVGSTSAPGDWKAYYQWQVVEQDAIFSLVSQDDFLQTTNFRGHVAGLQYRWTDAIQLHLWGLVSQREEPDTVAGQTDQTQWRVRGDVNIRF